MRTSPGNDCPNRRVLINFIRESFLPEHFFGSQWLRSHIATGYDMLSSSPSSVSHVFLFLFFFSTWDASWLSSETELPAVSLESDSLELESLRARSVSLAVSVPSSSDCLSTSTLLVCDCKTINYSCANPKKVTNKDTQILIIPLLPKNTNTLAKTNTLQIILINFYLCKL